jgi:hypothetical protein
MSDTFLTDTIDRLAAQELSDGRWIVTFRSTSAGLHHQLYVNGSLAAWTEDPVQRSFTLDASASPREIVIAAVENADRSVDFSSRLPAENRTPPNVFRIRVARNPSLLRGSRTALLTDHAAGITDETPLAMAELWPDRLPRWAWGEDAFAAGAFGFDASIAPGLGKGAFGAGMMGFDVDGVELSAALAEEGLHSLVIRTYGPDGRFADSEPISFYARVPPAPAAGLSVASYDAQTSTLTLEIQRGQP